MKIPWFITVPIAIIVILIAIDIDKRIGFLLLIITVFSMLVIGRQKGNI